MKSGTVFILAPVLLPVSLIGRLAGVILWVFVNGIMESRDWLLDEDEP